MLLGLSLAESDKLYKRRWTNLHEVRKKAEFSEEGAPGKERKPSFPASSCGGSTGTYVYFRSRKACICRGIYKPFISSLSFSSSVKGDENAYFTYSSNK